MYDNQGRLKYEIAKEKVLSKKLQSADEHNSQL